MVGDSGLVAEQKTESPFTQATMDAAVAMRQALTNLVSALPGGISRPRELERTLEIDYKLCWRVFLVIRAADGLSAASLMPKRPSIRRLLDAAKRHGVPAKNLEALGQAADAFDEMVRVHAGTRVAFDSMVAGFSPVDGAGQIDLVERRTAFRVNAHIWGSQVDTFVSGYMVRAAREGDGVDVCSLTARLGLKRFRPGARAVVYRYAVQEENASPLLRPLDVEAQRIHGASLLPLFCTQPLPVFKTRTSGNSGVSYELADNAFGQSSSVDLAFGRVIRNRPTQVSADGRRVVETGVGFRTPAARMILDLIVHRPSFGRATPESVVFTASPEEDAQESGSSEELPVRADVVAVAGGIAGAQTPEAPRYGEMLRYACKTLEWDPAEFDIYRVAMEYPVLHSMVRLKFQV